MDIARLAYVEEQMPGTNRPVKGAHLEHRTAQGELRGLFLVPAETAQLGGNGILIR